MNQINELISKVNELNRTIQTAKEELGIVGDDKVNEFLKLLDSGEFTKEQLLEKIKEINENRHNR